jgi:isochorismate synthase
MIGTTAAGLPALMDCMESAVRSGWCCALWREPHAADFWLAAAPDAPRRPVSLCSEEPGFGISSWNGGERWIAGRLLLRVRPDAPIQVEAGDPAVLSPACMELDWTTGLTSPCTETGYVGAVEAALRPISEGVLQKVVLSRIIEAPAAGSPWSAFQRLADLYPEAFCTAAWLPDEGLWMGASPELLASREPDGAFRTMALAGTRPLPESGRAEDASWSQKEIEEQALVSRGIIDEFKRIRLREFHEDGPRSVAAGRMAHLRTDFFADSEALGRPELPDTMKSLLHPTSATCGMPRAEARRFIDRHEGYDRRLYCGWWGPVAIAGASRAYVNLRTMRWMGDRAWIYAGAGIIRGSRPSQELAETELKAQTLLRVLRG